MFQAINHTFGTDLLITTSILVISVAFGLYLSLAFLVFIGDHGEHALFVTAYLLYAIIPALRCGVVFDFAVAVVVTVVAFGVLLLLWLQP